MLSNDPFAPVPAIASQIAGFRRNFTHTSTRSRRLFLATLPGPHYCCPTQTQRKPMLLRKLASVLVFLALPQFIAAQTPTPPQQTTGTKASVEKRLKADEKLAAPEIDDVVKTLRAAHRFAETEISPDGTHIAWVETLTGKDGAPNGNTAMYVKNIKTDSAPVRVTAGLPAAFHAEGNIAWSNDSKYFAFLTDAIKKDQQQLYIVPADGGAPRKLTHVKGFLDAPLFSPDNKTISVLFTENATRASGPLVAETPETGEIKDSFFEQRLAVIDVATGKLRQISPAGTYVYEYDWARDGLRFAVTAALGNGDNNWWVAELYTLEGASGLMKSIYKPQLQIANPVWSPDGEKIAFIEGLMSDAGLTGGDIFSVGASGGEAQDLTPEIKASPSWIGWTPEKKIIFTEFVGGDVGLASIDPQNKNVEALWRGGEYLTAGAGGFSPTVSLAKDGATMACVRESYAAPPEVWAGKVGEWKQITR